VIGQEPLSVGELVETGPLAECLCCLLQWTLRDGKENMLESGDDVKITA
jgi:hypothetical protein